MRIPWVGVIAVLFGAVGCAADGRQAIPDYSHFQHVSEGQHMRLYWNCVRTESGALRLEGVGLNRWEPAPLRFLEFVLSEVDDQGQVLARARGVAQGDLLQGFPAPFRLELKQHEGDTRVDLVYRYQYVDDSFDRLGRIPSYATQQVRDACGSDAHRNRTQRARRIAGVPQLVRVVHYGVVNDLNRLAGDKPSSRQSRRPNGTGLTTRRSRVLWARHTM